MLDTALWALEQEYWTSDAPYYEQRLTDDCLMVLPEPAGLQQKAEVVASIARARRWQHVELLDRHTVFPTAAVAVLSYRASARREGDAAAYEARVVSVHVLREGDWLMAFHQQSPLLAAKE